MKTVKFNYQGIARGASQQDIADGWCDEIINLRYRNGKLQSRGLPTKVKILPVELNTSIPESGAPLRWTKIWKHEQNNITNYVGFSDNSHWAEQSLRLIDFDGGTTTEIKVYTSIIDVQFLKRFMIVIHSGGMDRFIWKDGVYVLLNVVDAMPQFSLYLSDVELTESTEVYGPFNDTDVAEQVRGLYYSKLNEMSADNYFTGAMAVRAAFKLFDGTYVMHTVPRIISMTDLGIAFSFNKFNSNQTNNVSVKFTTAKLKTILLKSFFEQIDDLRDIIQGVVLFGSKFETIIKIDDSVDNEITSTIESSDVDLVKYTIWLNDIITTVNTDFKTMCDTASWYKIGEYPLSNIIEDDINEELDMKDFYQDYATRETLPVDSFSHHQIGGDVAYNYNSRLILGNIYTKFGDYRFFPLNPDVYGAGENLVVPPGFSEAGTLNIRMLATISTDSGDIVKLGQEFTRPKFIKPGEAGTVWYVNVGIGEIGYPDARATKIELLYYTDIIGGMEGWMKSGVSYSLTKSKNDNYAYYVNTNFTTARKDHYFGTANFPYIMSRIIVDANFVNIDAYPEQTLYDKNRVQISELNNPFFFPAENSYQVGTGQILQIATNTEPLSTGQFGEYPLIVFTGAGTWTMLQGQGDVLFSSVKPLNGDVIDNKDNVIAVPGGVTYTTPRGLFLQSGGKSISLSENLEGSPNLDLYITSNFTLRLNHIQLIQMPDAVSEVDFIDYLPDSKIGYDRILNELLVTNENYAYSYVYSFDAGKWTKISRSFPSLVNSYPKLLSVSYATGNIGLFDLSDENFDSQVSGVIVSRPCKIDGENNFILLHRALQRCEIETAANVYAGFYVFGSNDLIKWQLVAGNDRKSGRVADIITTRAHLKLKYFVFVFASTLKEKSAINSVEIQYYSKLTNKIR